MLLTLRCFYKNSVPDGVRFASTTKQNSTRPAHLLHVYAADKCSAGYAADLGWRLRTASCDGGQNRPTKRHSIARTETIDYIVGLKIVIPRNLV
jgi:hypothetical protein